MIMKKLITLFGIVLALMTAQRTNQLNAQDHTITVPGDYNHVVQALIQGVQNNDDVTDGQEILINVLEGETSKEGFFAEMPKEVKITIQGAGADKTIMGSRFDDKRWMHFAGNTPAGVELVVKDLTLTGFGSPDGRLGGGCFNIASENFKLTLTNVVFDSIESARGTIINAVGDTQQITIDNCFFTESTMVNGSGEPGGIIYKDGTGNLLIKNSTFMTNYSKILDVSDPDNPMDPGLRKGSILDIVADSAKTLTVNLENNAFLNNTFEEGASTDSIQPAVSLKARPYSDLTVQMTNNIFIENRRESAQNDVDLYVENADSITFITAENIANSAINRTFTDDDEPLPVIEDLKLDGFKVKAEYTYTHADIDFTMDGELPELLLDEDFIPYVEYSGDGGVGEPVMVESISIFTSTTADSVAIDETLQFVASVTPTDATEKTVTWSVTDGTGSATIDENGLLSPVSAGMVTVKAVANDDSGVEATMDVKVYDPSVGLDVYSASGISLYPNPTSGLLNIELPSGVNEATYQVYNALGSCVAEGSISENRVVVDFSDRAEGLYIIKMNAAGSENIERIIIQ